MIKSKEELSKFLEKRLDFYAVNKKHVETMTKYLVEKYNFKPGDASDLATQRASTDTESNFICFCLTDALSKVDNRTKLEDWFTEKEINAFSKEQIHRDSLSGMIDYINSNATRLGMSAQDYIKVYQERIEERYMNTNGFYSKYKDYLV